MTGASYVGRMRIHQGDGFGLFSLDAARGVPYGAFIFAQEEVGTPMGRIALALAVVAPIVLSASAARAGCNDSRLETVRDEILAACPCTGNHGQYVSCVAHAVRQAVTDERLDVNCKGKVVRCAARSTCGKKEGFVTCTICVPGTCETTAGMCDDGATACTDSAQCPQVVDRCSTKSDALLCEAKGGIVGTGSCCHASCTPG
jgi:hypothetical protein